MAETLFVDVDDTLILWKGENLLVDWKQNQAVIHFVEKWHATHPNGDVVVWSLGGQKYASDFGAQLLPHIPHTSRDKYPIIPEIGWLFIDDDPLASYRSATIHPDCLR